MSKAIENIRQALALIDQNMDHVANHIKQLKEHRSSRGAAIRILELETELAATTLSWENAERREAALTAKLKEAESQIASMNALYLKAAQIATDAERRASQAEKALKYLHGSKITNTVSAFSEYNTGVAAAFSGTIYGAGAGELAGQDVGVSVTYSDTKK